jgi:hypothetical protein
MFIKLILLKFFSEGEFFLGLSAGKESLIGYPVDEFTGEDIEGDSAKLGEFFSISIGLFFIIINIGLHVRFQDDVEEHKF